ncbi:antitoxin VbhA family protein [Variovorax sp. PAMC26660]|uniref:antitoxin VbhA family protein n=1 Tax=Variovorax sp. PAMC26660 TaxID=2762322 RepID=UPI00164E2367|nr:antitoxin VbhA family protein [Variovorax sp. PAMC26660]QNK67249.1 antitoxin VbhA family protein [Variovorax sp. PAMC26660]
MTTQEKRRDAMAQALANTRLAGHEPTPRFLADVAAVVAGKMTYDQAIRASAARATRNGSGLPGPFKDIEN